MTEITALITCHNQAEYLGEAIESILNQSYEDFELIILCDGCTDNSIEIAEEYMEKCEEDIQVRQLNDLGASTARHHGIATGKGTYFIPLDADDYISPEYFEKALRLLEDDPYLGFAYCNSSYFGNQIKQFNQPEYNFWELVSRGNFISYCSLFRKNAYIDSGGYNLDNRNYMEDYELYIRLGIRGWYGKLLPYHFFHHRIHEANQTNDTQDMWPIYRSFIVLNYPEVHPPQLIKEAISTVKDLPENFMSLTKEEQKEIV